MKGKLFTTKIIFNDNKDNIARKSITPCALGELLYKGIYLTFKMGFFILHNQNCNLLKTINQNYF